MKNNFGNPKSGYNNIYPDFSFKNYQISEYFKEIDISNKKEFFNFFNNIQRFSSKTWEEIKKNKKQFHFHEIEFDKGIHSKLKIPNDIELIQFKLPSDKESRIVGYFDSDNIFNIVIYDYRHQIYPR